MRHEGGTHGLDRQRRDNPAGGIGRPQSNPIAMPDTGRNQGTSRLAHLLSKGCVGSSLAALDDSAVRRDL